MNAVLVLANIAKGEIPPEVTASYWKLMAKFRKGMPPLCDGKILASRFNR